MRFNSDHPLRRLRSQLIASFLLGFLGIALAVGIPLILTINRQAASQSRLLLDQAVLGTHALLSGEQTDLENLALLISQRPTLIRLLDAPQDPALKEYIATLQKGAGLDLLAICEQDRAVIESDSAGGVCQLDAPSGYLVPPAAADHYLYASTAMEQPAQPAYRIVIGRALTSILPRLQSETGLLYFLFQQGTFIGTSDPLVQVPPVQLSELQNLARNGASSSQPILRLGDHQYLPASLTIDSASGLALIPALNVDSQRTVQRNLLWTLVLGLLAVILISAGLGVLLSQRLSQPIARLADAATGFRQGNLDSPVSVHSSVWEINQLANTLEDARIALQHSLHQIQAKSAWDEQLLHSIVEGILTLDNQDRITFASAGLARVLDDDPGRVLGRRIDEVFLPAEGETAFSTQLPEVGQQRRVSVRLKNGQPRLLSISKARFVPPEAENANRALVIRDVSQDEYLHRLLGDFLANITHEFRTPLAALEASSELLLDHLHTLSREEMEELLTSLNLGIIDLQTLIDNLIEAASIEAGRFRVSVSPVPFEGILNDALAVIRPLARKYSLRLEAAPADESLRILADPRRTVQALVNLLSNAVKHSPENGVIRIAHEVRGKALCVEVSDEGSGFTADQQGQLFRRFSHLDTSHERARHGAGLGLSVVKAIVEAQQGEVGIRDTHGRGAAIWFTVLLATEAEA